MREIEALQCVAVLTIVDLPNRWPDDRVEAWAAYMRTHHDPTAGLRASEALVRNAQPHDWSLARWSEAYRQATSSEAPISLPRGREPEITLDEHLELLRTADTPEAHRELALWARWRTLFRGGTR